MTTLTPEKESELRGLLEKATPWAESPHQINITRRHESQYRDVGVVLHEDIAGLSAGLFMVQAAQKCVLALPDLLSTLSTEREGRERAEAEVERLKTTGLALLVVTARVFERIHSMPRASDTELANQLTEARMTFSASKTGGA